MTNETDAFIWTSPHRQGGKPCIGGTRLPVSTIASYVWGGGVDFTISGYPQLSRAQVLIACWHIGIYGPATWRRRWGSWARAADDYNKLADPPTEPRLNGAVLPAEQDKP